MEMKKIACAILITASATVALAADGPALAPAGALAGAPAAGASAATGAFPAVGAVLGASVLSFFAYYMQ
ncbi:hypothetical protein ACQJBY_063945 [Aegilops geniculata]